MKKLIWIILVLLIVGAVVWFLTRSSDKEAEADGQAPAQTEAQAEGQGVSDAAAVASAIEVVSDTEELAAVCPALGHSWLELPGQWTADAEHCVTHYAEMEGRQQRNFTMLYDEDTYTSYWVAYPLCASHTTTGRQEDWGYDPKVSEDRQTSVRKGYGASIPTKNYPKNFYARGHQLPNADRSRVPQMQAQTYYSTNMTPQIQNGFNGGIWAKLEDAVRKQIPRDDTLYIVTGAAFRKVNENLAASTILNKNDGKTLPVPNYYWKVVLKVKRDADVVTDASTIGFWLPHEDLKGRSYADYVVSVDQIEQWTGFDFFVNLPDEKEKAAETNESWQSFQTF